MTAGQQPSNQGLNITLTTLAVALRNLMADISNFTTYVNTLGTSGLEAAGFSPTDTATMQTAASYLSTFPLVYNGVQFQGTTANNAIQFNFNNALSAYWGGQ